MNVLKKFSCITLLALYITQINASRKSTSIFRVTKTSKNFSKKTYSSKTPYSGLGKQSSVNGRIKYKPVSGYFKPSNGYKYVNPYSRSK